MSDFEIGVTEGNVVVIAWKAVKTVFRTWWFARQHNLPRNKWYGVYIKGTEYKLADMGCLPAAKHNANLFVSVLHAQPDSCSTRETL